MVCILLKLWFESVFQTMWWSWGTYHIRKHYTTAGYHTTKGRHKLCYLLLEVPDLYLYEIYKFLTAELNLMKHTSHLMSLKKSNLLLCDRAICITLDCMWYMHSPSKIVFSSDIQIPLKVWDTFLARSYSRVFSNFSSLKVSTLIIKNLWTPKPSTAILPHQHTTYTGHPFPSVCGKQHLPHRAFCPLESSKQ